MNLKANPLWEFRGIFNHIPRNFLATFPEMFGDILRNVWRHSPECLRTFPGMFGDILRNVSENSPECLRTFPESFHDIPRNIRRHSMECLATFTGMFEDTPQNVWRYSPEYNIPLFPTFPAFRSPLLYSWFYK